MTDKMKIDKTYTKRKSKYKYRSNAQTNKINQCYKVN